MFCKNCGKPLDDNARFCPNCGARIDAAPAPRREVPPERRSPERPPERSAERYAERPPERAPERAPERDYVPPRNSNAAPKQAAPKKQSFWKSKISSILLTAVAVVGGNMLISMFNGPKTPPPAQQTVQTQQQQQTATQQTVTQQSASKQTQVQQTAAKPTATKQAAKNYNAKTRPSMQEFNWAAGVMANGVPKAAQALKDFDDIRGTWKCMITYDPERKKKAYCRDLSNVTISGYEKTANFILDWYQVYYEGEPPADMTKDADTALKGEFFRNPSGKGMMEVKGNPYPYVSGQFYAYQGKQYFYGNIMCKNGVTGFVTMVRP